MDKHKICHYHHIHCYYHHHNHHHHHHGHNHHASSPSSPHSSEFLIFTQPSSIQQNITCWIYLRMLLQTIVLTHSKFVSHKWVLHVGAPLIYNCLECLPQITDAIMMSTISLWIVITVLEMKVQIRGPGLINNIIEKITDKYEIVSHSF